MKRFIEKDAFQKSSHQTERLKTNHLQTRCKKHFHKGAIKRNLSLVAVIETPVLSAGAMCLS